MARDDLNDPLGMDLADADKPQRAIPYRSLALGGCGLLALSLVAFANFNTADMGGEPFAVAAIQAQKKPEAPSASLPAVAAAAVSPEVTGTIAAAKSPVTAEEYEMQSGVKVIRRGGAMPSGALIIQVPQAASIQLNPAPDPRLVEKSRFGLLPKTGADGSRPAEVYARPIFTGGALKAGAPRIAIMVGGMGLASSATQDAVEKLPGAVTLAFAPYGADLDRQASQARASGHEVILQAPMEPFDPAQNNPGPHTLRQEADVGVTMEDLHWLMGRFVGYAGVGNFLGARFTSSEAAMTPVLKDIGARGLYYVDDGASPQSVALNLARDLGVEAVKADVVIDARSDAIPAALVALEALARKNGSALGIASALPGSVEQVARFARSLEARGIALVPVSALASRQPKISAQRQ